MMKHITAPITPDEARALHCGDRCLLSGVIYTARDAAHKRLCELLAQGKPLPIDLTDAVIYYVGPTPTPPGRVIGSAGPTTAGRMDAYAPALIAHGLTGMIGKGSRSPEVIEAMHRHGAVYLGAVGGCGALLSRCVKSCRVVAYPDLGPEAIHRLEVENLPLTVLSDPHGKTLYP